MSPKIFIYQTAQDDPKKCSGTRMIRYGFAAPVYRLGRFHKRPIILDPFASNLLNHSDKEYAIARGILVVDCSWSRVEEVFPTSLEGLRRRLPPLLAANPVNFAQLGKLSSLEAVAASLYILGFKEPATRVLNIIKWGPRFLELNQEPLEAYRTSTSQEELVKAAEEFFPRSKWNYWQLINLQSPRRLSRDKSTRI
ncbi:MAG: DUF367 family protein [Candidatus Bathyarchaeia archaeon]